MTCAGIWLTGLMPGLILTTPATLYPLIMTCAGVWLTGPMPGLILTTPATLSTLLDLQAEANIMTFVLADIF